MLLQDRVALELDELTAVLTLARPERGNALDLAAARALREAAECCRARADLRVVHLRAQGSAFCVGGDLTEFSGAADLAGHVHEVASTVHEAMGLLRDLPAILLTEVQGVAAGGGVGLALLGDVVLAGLDARFRSRYTAAGLSPDAGLSALLASVVGPARALDFVLTNRELSAAEAERWGLVSRVLDGDELEDSARRLVDDLAASSPASLWATRELVRSAPGRSWVEQLEQEAASIARLAASPHGREGVAAFLGKRVPDFGVRPASAAADHD